MPHSIYLLFVKIIRSSLSTLNTTQKCNLLRTFNFFYNLPDYKMLCNMVLRLYDDSCSTDCKCNFFLSLI